MGQPQTTQQPKERRVKNFSEVSLGYPKAVSLTESRRCPQCALPTCMNGCPLGIDIPGFIRLLREGDAVGALNRIKENNILPGVCGRVCLAPCETACIFSDEDAPIGIRALERYASDNGRARNAGKDRPAIKSGKKIAVIGSGPSGLAAAADLAKKGYDVTIFEALSKAGGALRYGIPEFRLPSRVLDAEINDILALGITIQTNVVVGQSITFEELLHNYQAIFLAVGSGSPQFTPMTGDHLIGVYYAQELLLRVNLWKARQYPKASLSPLLGNTVAIIGCGHAAVDCARMVARLGKKASIIFPGLEEDVAVYPSEKKNAVEEGVCFESLVQPLEILSTEDNRVKGLQCERLDFIENAEGRCDVKAVPGSGFVFAADTIIFADSSKPSDAVRRFLPGLRWTQEGTVWVDPESGKTSVDRVFAAGDVATKAGSLVDAMASGKRAALAMDRFLSEQTVLTPKFPS